MVGSADRATAGIADMHNKAMSKAGPAVRTPQLKGAYLKLDTLAASMLLPSKILVGSIPFYLMKFTLP
jgi:hypothetical protein